MATDTKTDNLVINKLTKAQYDEAWAAGTLSDTELYIITDENLSLPAYPTADGDYYLASGVADGVVSTEWETKPTTLSAFTDDLGDSPTHTHSQYAKASDLKTVATTGSYNDLTDKPTIPAAVTVDSALSDTSENPVQNKVINSALSGKANASAIPTKVSQLTNDSGFTTNTGTITGIKMNGASKGTSGVVDLGTVLTSHQSLSGYATETWVNNKGYTTNTGTVTSVAVKMNGSTKGTVTSSGTIDLGTVLTAHQSLCVSTTYANLKSLRDAGTLTPGATYRITDYEFTTTQAGSSSAGHGFDILVIADDKSTLNENARAIARSGDTYYSDSGDFPSDLSAWELKYCLDNDLSRFSWADATNGKGVIYYMKDDRGNIAPYDHKNCLFTRYEVTNSVTELSSLSGQYLGTTSGVSRGLTKGTDTKTYLTFDRYCYDNRIEPYRTSVTIDGTTYADTAKLNDITICAYSQDRTNTTKHLYGNTFETNCHDITFAPDYSSPYCNSNSFGNDCYSNSFGSSCYSNSFGSGCSSNSFGYSCSENSFGDNCTTNFFGNVLSYSSFGNYCSYNSFGNRCFNNSFGNNCYYNSFSNGCYSNSFGNYCSYNSFGDNCTTNFFGNYCESIYFGDYCSYNSFGNYCLRTNTFGDYCQNNSFGNACWSNTFGDYCQYNSFGNSCMNNTFGDYCFSNSFGDSCVWNYLCNGIISSTYLGYARFNAFENGVSYVSLYDDDLTGSSSAYLQNVHIHEGVLGTSSSRKVISVDRNLAYGTDIYAEGHVTMTV